MAYAMILENREKIESDLESLKNNPIAKITNLGGISYVYTSNNNAPENIGSEKVVSERMSTNASDDNSSFAEQHETDEVENRVADEIRQMTTSECYTESKKTPDDTDGGIEKISDRNLSTPTSADQPIPSSSEPINDSNEDELGIGQGTEETPSFEKETDIEENSRTVHLSVPLSAFSVNQLSPSPSISMNNSSQGRVEVAQEIEESSSYSQINLDGGNISQTTLSVSAAIPRENEQLSTPAIPTNNSNEDHVEVGQDVERGSSSEEDTDDEQDPSTIPPPPAAIPIVNFLSSQPSLPNTDEPHTDMSEHEPEVKREIPFIDLTDDCDVKEECPAHKEQLLQETPHEIRCACPPSNTTSAPLMLESNKNQTTAPIYSNSSCGVNPIISTSRIQPQTYFVPPDFHGIWCDPNMSQTLNYVPVNSSPNMPYLVGDVQIPLLVNIPTVRNDGTSITDQLYAQIQVFQQPTSYLQNQEHKS